MSYDNPKLVSTAAVQHSNIIKQAKSVAFVTAGSQHMDNQSCSILVSLGKIWAQQNELSWRTFWLTLQWTTILRLMIRAQICFTFSSQCTWFLWWRKRKATASNSRCWWWRVVRPLCSIGSPTAQHALTFKSLRWRHHLPHPREISLVQQAWCAVNYSCKLVYTCRSHDKTVCHMLKWSKRLAWYCNFNHIFFR